MITPLNPYVCLMLIILRRYEPDAKRGGSRGVLRGSPGALPWPVAGSRRLRFRATSR
ncbi:hypothetical protein JOC24_005788 [Streptomyces sp. HB132]|nr:hypothetical protein [Streptomyces sp. HB132]